MAPSAVRRALLIGLPAVCAGVLPFTDVDLGASDLALGGALAVIALGELLTAVLLGQRFVARGSAPLLGLAGTYLLGALATTAVLVAVPGHPQAAAWLWVLGRGAVAAGLAASLWGGPRAARRMLAEPTLRRARVAGLAAAGVAVAVAVPAVALPAGEADLPALVTQRALTDLGLAAGLALAVVQAAALVVVVRRGRRGDLERPLALVAAWGLAATALALTAGAPWSGGFWAAIAADAVAASVLLGALITEVGRLHRRLTAAADRAGGPSLDPLTGARTRGATIAAAEHLHRTRLPGTPLAVAGLEIDGLKALGDSYGPLAADAILVTVAGRLRAELRDEDVLGRAGEEGFLLLLPGTDVHGATLALDRAVAAVRAEPVGTWARHVAVTASAGLAMVGDGDAAVPAALEEADRALTQAKANGRDRVVSPARGQLVELHRGGAGPRPD
jgi:diguanylate cyclase (GGDEF)-like protein